MYLGKLCRNKKYQSVIADWSLIKNLMSMNADREEILQMGFNEDFSDLLVNRKIYDDVIIATLESTHLDENNAISIFSDESSTKKENFFSLLLEKNKEFEKVLMLIALQCPIDEICKMVPTWVENKRIASRIRKEHPEEMINIRMTMFRNKKKMYNFYNPTTEEMIVKSKLEVKGRVTKPRVEELFNIDRAMDTAKERGLMGIEKYIYIATTANVLINQIFYRKTKYN